MLYGSQIFNEITSYLRGITAGLLTYVTSIICPIHNFYNVIILLAFLNVVAGVLADNISWSFKKAFGAFKYLGGYLALLSLTLVIGRLMNQDDQLVIDAISYITWVMIYFYATNIFRNWNKVQPNNKVIFFLYWLFTFKMIENIKFMKEFNDSLKKEEENETQ